MVSKRPEFPLFPPFPVPESFFIGSQKRGLRPRGVGICENFLRKSHFCAKFWKKIRVFSAQKLHLAAVFGRAQKITSGSGKFRKISGSEKVQKSPFFLAQISEKDPPKKLFFGPLPSLRRFPTKMSKNRRFGANFPVPDSALFAKSAKNSKSAQKHDFSVFS